MAEVTNQDQRFYDAVSFTMNETFVPKVDEALFAELVALIDSAGDGRPEAEPSPDLERAIEICRTLTESDDSGHRRWVGDALGPLARVEPEITAGLIDLLLDDDEAAVRTTAAHHASLGPLVQADSSLGVPLLERALSDPDQGVREQAEFCFTEVVDDVSPDEAVRLAAAHRAA